MGVQGAQGASGAQGSSGAQGATGFLSSGATGSMPYWNGTSWIRDATNLYNVGGNIGIGTSSPQAKLHISAASAYTALRIADGTQSLGRVLTSDADGDVRWSPTTALTPAVVGVLGASGFSGSLAGQQATNSYVDLPPGKWSVQISVLVQSDPYPDANQGVWVRMHLSDTSNGGITGDIVSGGGKLVSGPLHGPTPYSVITGTIVVNSSGASSKRYYLVKGSHDNYPVGYTASFLNLGGNAAEIAIVAYPMN